MKMKDKGKEVVEGGKNQPPRETEPQRKAKQPHTMQMKSATEEERRANHQVATPVWVPQMELNRAPLLDNAPIRNFQRGTTRYVADAMEQSLLLPKDMADLRSIRQHEVFLGLKRDLAMVSFLS